jgi:hypothetical protein
MINTRVIIDYDDQNEDFSKFLPRKGKIIQQLTDEYANDDWFLVELDEPFEYQLRTDDNFQFKLIKCDKFLIRSRWKNHEINSKEGTSIFILLIPDESKLFNVPMKINSFVQIAWGFVKGVD